jgi:hypothetical protein
MVGPRTRSTERMYWERLLQPDVLVFLIPISAILVGGAVAITKLLIRHRERLAMIEHGMHPDQPPVGDRQDPLVR